MYTAPSRTDSSSPGHPHDALDEVRVRAACRRRGAGALARVVVAHRLLVSAPAGGLNTTMSPRSGSPKRKLTRSTSTRWPTSSVGTIDSLGMRKGLTRKAWMPSASPSATTTIITNSTSELRALFSLLRAAMGFRRPGRPTTWSSSPASAVRRQAPARRRQAHRPRRLGPRRPYRRRPPRPRWPLGPRVFALRRRLGRSRSVAPVLAGRILGVRRPLGRSLLRRHLLGQRLLAGAGRFVRRHRAGLDRLQLAGPAAFAHTGAAAHAVAQVVQLRAAHVAAGGHLDPLDLRRVQRERPLDPDAERLLADGEGLACAAALALQDDALEHLRAAPGALHHLEVHTHPVARLEGGHTAQLSALEAFDDSGHGERWGGHSTRGEAQIRRDLPGAVARGTEW